MHGIVTEGKPLFNERTRERFLILYVWTTTIVVFCFLLVFRREVFDVNERYALQGGARRFWFFFYPLYMYRDSCT